MAGAEVGGSLGSPGFLNWPLLAKVSFHIARTPWAPSAAWVSKKQAESGGLKTGDGANLGFRGSLHLSPF